MLKYLLALYVFTNPISKEAVYHDIHVSVCEIDIQADQAEVLIKTFLDDLQIATGLIPGEEIPEDYTSAEEMIDDYIRRSFSLVINGRRALLELHDIASSLDAVWLTYKAESATLDSPEVVEVRTSLLTEIYNDQTNLIKLRFGDLRESSTLGRRNKSVTFNLIE